MRKLYYGDNYDILRHYIDGETVDLVYLDPPFKSDQNYNVLFRDRSGDLSTAQIRAFEDTWTWDVAAARSYDYIVTEGPERVSLAMQAFRKLIGESDMLAYLSMMAPRLVELHRVLKPTGSLYLHCDPTASHYLKLLLDAVFTPQQFRSEVIWKRTSSHNSANRWGPVHDTLLFYSKTDEFIWNAIYEDYDPVYVEAFFTHVDDDGRRWQRGDLTGNGTRDGDSGEPWKGINPTEKGRHWAVAKWAVEVALEKAGRDPTEVELMSTQDKLDLLDLTGRIHWPKKEGGMPRLKRFLDDLPGAPAQDIITDIKPLHNLAQERLGYPTQKPEELLERIIEASSNEGDVVLDPFCGCGTTIAAAEKLNREWIGIDITHLAITLIKHRLRDSYGDEIADQFDVLGEPTTIEGAEDLAQLDRHQFEYWALGLVGARPHEQKKGADRGIDGRVFFIDDPNKGAKEVIISVKSGTNVGVAAVRDLRGTVEREGAAIGVLITLHEPTSAMRKEAASAGFYKSPFGSHPKIQIVTIEELLDGRLIDYPKQTQRLDRTFKKAKRSTKKSLSRDTPGLFDGA